MHRGPAGAGALNERLQEALTPAREDCPSGASAGGSSASATRSPRCATTTTRAPPGSSTAPSASSPPSRPTSSELTVLPDEDEEVDYDFDELDELAHAYAVTIHRSQGSEYPAVVIPLTTSAWMMLQRNLLYTAVTRAKRLVVLVGSRRALAQAVRTQGAGRRHTSLTERLRPGAVGATAAAS